VTNGRTVYHTKVQLKTIATVAILNKKGNLDEKLNVSSQQCRA